MKKTDKKKKDKSKNTYLAGRLKSLLPFFVVTCLLTLGIFVVSPNNKNYGFIYVIVLYYLATLVFEIMTYFLFVRVKTQSINYRINKELYKKNAEEILCYYNKANLSFNDLNKRKYYLKNFSFQKGTENIFSMFIGAFITLISTKALESIFELPIYSILTYIMVGGYLFFIFNPFIISLIRFYKYKADISADEVELMIIEKMINNFLETETK